MYRNLKESNQTTPILGREKGVALVSGFSKKLLKIFMTGDGEIDLESVMKAVDAGEKENGEIDEREER